MAKEVRLTNSMRATVLSQSSTNEQTPLLSNTSSKQTRVEDQGRESDSEDCNSGHVSNWRVTYLEAMVLLRLSTPVIISYMLQTSFQTFSILIVGRKYPDHLSTAAFSYGFATVTGFLVAVGGSTAFDTLASSTFTGSKNKHALGILLQRAAIALTIFYLPVAVLWCISESLFVILGQDKTLSRESATFLQCLTPGGLGYVYLELLKKYLQVQGIIQPQTWILSVTALVSIGLNYTLVVHTTLGVYGAPIATGASFWLSCIALLVYTRYWAVSDTWGGWDRRCLQNMGEFVRLSLMGFLHIGTEWWAFEIITILAGLLGTTELSAQSAIMTLDAAIVAIPFGIGIATSTRVGNILGLQDARRAARSSHSATIVSILLGISTGVILITFPKQVARIFTSDLEVVDLVVKILPYVGLYQVGDGLNASCGGALRGMGRQAVGATVNIVCFYCLTLAPSTWLAFHGWDLAGLWIGQAGALLLIGVIEGVIVASTDWQLQVEKAFERMD